MVIGLAHYLVVAAVLFTIGVFGIFVNRKNIIVILMSIELILLAVNINLVAFSAYLHDITGQIFAMIVLTLISMFAISTRMLALRNDMVFIDDVPHDDARRVEFNHLHVWSTRLESTVLLLGLAVIFLTARRLS